MSERDAKTTEAVEAVKVAVLLFERYRRDAAALATDTAVSLDERLLSLDQSYQGIWEQLDRAAGLMGEAGLDIRAFSEVRAQVRDAYQGYKQHDELRIGLGGVEQRTTYSINAIRFRHIQQALHALQAAAPGQSFAVERVEEVEQFLSAQRSPLRVLKPVIWLLVIAAGVAAVLLGFQWLRPTDYGPDSRKIYTAEAALEKAPCDKQKIIELVELLNGAGAHAKAIERAEAFFKRCGEHRRLRWATFTAHKRMGDWKGAVAEATRLIEAVPRDRDYRWWRGEAHEQAGELEPAIVDYRQAVALEPFLRNIPFNLANLLERVGRPCEGLFWIGNYAHHHPGERARLAPRLVRLWAMPACRRLAGSGAVVVPLPGGESGPRVQAVINNAEPRELSLDPDALYVMLSAGVAAELKLETKTAPELLVRTADGFFPTRLTRVARLALRDEGGDATAIDVPVVVGDKLPGDADGIIGQSFLTRFLVRRDPAAIALEPVPLP